ncbi:MAG: hypothetical protein KDK78_11125, partial [Chlamydiia bacterium]|nr:hypothetical protein [Chlamydiia bacterium]
MQFTTLPVLTEVNPLEVLADWSTASQDRFITQGKKSVDQLLDSAARLAQAIIPKRWFAVISRYIVQANHELDPDGYRYWDQITTFTWLGAMPLENYGHVEKITEIGVKAILSINEEHEFLA